MLNKPHRDIEHLSVVTPVYNHEATIADTLDSILMQKTSRRFHIYCLNDASTDSSGAILAEYQARYPEKISIFTSSENQGSGKKSIVHNRPPIRGRYWTLLAGDDYWVPSDKIEKQISTLDETPSAQGCCSHTVVRFEKTGEESIIQPGQQRFKLMDLALGRNPFYAHTSSIIWRNTFAKDGFFLPSSFMKADITGDTVLLHMCLVKGGEIINYPEVTSCYRVTGRGVWSMLTQ